MVIPQFLRFYAGYDLRSVFDECARSFFALVEAMYRLQATERINRIADVTYAGADDKYRNEELERLQKQAEGTSAIVREVRTIRGK